MLSLVSYEKLSTLAIEFLRLVILGYYCQQLEDLKCQFVASGAEESSGMPTEFAEAEDYFAFSRASVRAGMISKISPTTPESAISRMGASESLLMAPMVSAP